MQVASLPEPVPAIARHSRQPVWVAAVLTLFLLSLTYLYWRAEERAAHLRGRQAFDMAADRISFSIKSRMAIIGMVLRGVKGYYDGSAQIDPGEFQAYVGALELPQTLPGLQGIAYVMRLPHGQAPAHEQAMRGTWGDAYRIWPEGEGDVHRVITHIEPLNEVNRRVLGFDVGTVRGALEALDRARDTGGLALTGRIGLRQYADEPEAQGLVMYFPIYRSEVPLQTVEQRRAALIGWVSAPFRMADLLQGMQQQLDADVGLSIFDGAPSDPAAQIHGAGAPPSAPFQETRYIEVGGRRWTLVMHSLPSFTNRLEDSGQALVALPGAVLSLLVGGLAWVLGTARERAVALALRMTQTLRSTRDDLESTLNAIPDLLFELGLDGRIHHYRSARSDLLAAPPGMFLNRLLQDVVPPEAAPGCKAALQAAHHTGYSAGHQFSLELGKKPTGSSSPLPERRAMLRIRSRASLPCRATSPSASSRRRAHTNWPISTH